MKSKGPLTYAARSIHLHWVQKAMVIRGRGGLILSSDIFLGRLVCPVTLLLWCSGVGVLGWYLNVVVSCRRRRSTGSVRTSWTAVVREDRGA
jgi:hypothetical protein